MTKQEKLQEREEHFLLSARTIVARDGIFDFKMTDIAKEAKYSVGTLYIHFQSKEDVVIALACASIKDTLRYFQEINLLDIPFRDKLLAYPFVSQIRRKNENFISELEQLVTNSCVRNRASKQRSMEYDMLLKQPLALVEETIENACKSEFSHPMDPGFLKNNLLFGLWSLSLGELSISELNIFEKKELSPTNPFVQNCVTLINSYDWKDTLEEQRVEEIIEIIEKVRVEIF